MADATPPPALANAIANAAKQYGVPADVLTGIWREESGSTYPNPAVNSAGYGGLFGTTNWNAPTQAQADTAASILATGYQKSGGNTAEALSYYNSGKLVGGYTSVPGVNTGGSSPYQAPPRPTGNAGLDASFTSQLVGDGVNYIGGSLPVIGGLIQGVSGVTDALKVVAWLFSPKHWAQALELLVGVGSMAAGVFWLGGGSEGAFDVPIPIAGAAAKAPSKVIGKAVPEAVAAA